MAVEIIVITRIKTSQFRNWMRSAKFQRIGIITLLSGLETQKEPSYCRTEL